MLRVIKKYWAIGASALVLGVSGTAHAGFITFDTDGNFIVPNSVSEVRVLLIGGGAAGAGSHYVGGGSGYLESGVFAVGAGDSIGVTVGSGGASAGCAGNQCFGSDGLASMFGAFLTALGGQAADSIGVWGEGGPSGSGGGGAGNSGFGGAGGSGGANGVNGNTYLGEVGQGTTVWDSHFALITEAIISAGLGGVQSTGRNQGGGGGGGILIDGAGIAGGNATGFTHIGGFGGDGYGAGGGSAGYSGQYGIAGSGANGFVYIEWDDATVPEPTTLALFGLGLAGLGFARRKKA